MNPGNDHEYNEDSTFEDAGAPIAMWTLDDLEHSADFGSVRSAWTSDDDLS